MIARSTSVKGFVHYGGEVRSGTEDAVGISLGHTDSNSTSIAWVEAVSDQSNANIGIKGKGTGGVAIGAGAAFKGAYSTTFAWTLGALSSGAQGEITLSTAVGDIMPGDLIGQIELYPAAQDDFTIQHIRTSTAVASRVTVIVGNIGSTATSTASGTGRITWIDLT